MATVTITGNLARYILSKIDDGFRHREQLLLNEFNNLPLADEMYNFLVSPEERHMLQILGDKGLLHEHMRVSTMSIVVQNNIGHGIRVESTFSNTPKYAPIAVARDIITINQATQIPSRDAAISIATQIEQLNEERSNAYNSCQNILRNCRTLKQVLEHWEGAFNYLPDWAIKQHHAAKQPRKRVKPEIEELSTDVKVALIKNRMVGAANESAT